MMRTIDFEDWLASVEVEQERVRSVEAGFVEPYRRQRARDPEEAAFLRRGGTDERVIGPSPDETARRAFAVPARSGSFRGVDLAWLDPDDRDDRHVLIEAEHPDLAEAIERGEQIVIVGGEEVDPRLHLTLHEILIEQLLNDDPPEVWSTARTLIAAGYARHEILHMLGSALAPQLWRVAKGDTFSYDEYHAALARLPSGWDGERGEARSSARTELAARIRKAARQARKRRRR